MSTELHRAFNESLQTLKLLGVRSSLYVDESLSMLSGKTAFAGTWTIWWKRAALKAEKHWLQPPLKTNSW